MEHGLGSWHIATAPTAERLRHSTGEHSHLCTVTVTLTLWQPEVDIADLNQVESILAGINLYPYKTETLKKNPLNCCCFEDLSAWEVSIFLCVTWTPLAVLLRCGVQGWGWGNSRKKRRLFSPKGGDSEAWRNHRCPWWNKNSNTECNCGGILLDCVLSAR